MTKDKGHGLTADRAYFFVGGDKHYERMYGHLKDVKFFSTKILSSKE